MKPISRVEALAVSALAECLSGRRRSARLLVLIFHRVLPEPDPLLPSEPDRQRFSAQVDLLSRCFRLLPLREGVRRLHEGTLPSRAACITFDDGYENNATVAQPILAAKGAPATMFVAPGFLDGGRMFNDTVIEAVRRAPVDFDLSAEGLGRHDLRAVEGRRACIDTLLRELKHLPLEERRRKIDRIAECAGATLPTDLMMTTAQVRDLHRSGIEIGAHTIDHPILESTDDATAERQIAESKRVLETITGAPVRSFAYPNGRPGRDYSARHVAMVRSTGFDLALSTAWGVADVRTDMLQIPRVAAWDVAALKYGLRLSLAYRAREFATA